MPRYNTPFGVSPKPMSPAVRRGLTKRWYARREELHLERAKLQVPILTECAVAIALWSNEGKLSTVETFQQLVRTVVYTGYDKFSEMGNDLSDLGGEVVADMVHRAVPSLKPFIAWLQKADARLGEYPGGNGGL